MRVFFRMLLAFGVGLMAIPRPAAAQTAENVLVVINNQSDISRRIGEYYATRRSIPGKNLCRIASVDSEEVSWQVFRDEVQAPVAECLRSQQLREKILYIVTTSGVPLKIAGSGGRLGDAASVDSELALLYQRLGGKEPPTAGPARNPFFGKLNDPFELAWFPIYLVTRLAAYDFEDVRGMIDRCLQADNRGVFVLDLNNRGNDDGNRWLREAARALPERRVLLEQSPAVVYEAEDVIGYASWGSNDDRRAKEGRRLLGFRWLPGAIATEYVSSDARTFQKPPDTWTFGATPEHRFGGSNQSLTADFIADGASGASGHVYEPFLQFSPRPEYLFAAYYSGRTLAESFYLAMPAVSWMNVVVGDPLCRIGPPRP